MIFAQKKFLKYECIISNLSYFSNCPFQLHVSPATQNNFNQKCKQKVFPRGYFDVKIKYIDRLLLKAFKR